VAKIQSSVTLSPEVWAQIDALIPYFGESRGEAIAHALNIWFGKHGQDIREQKERIDALKPQIDALIEQNEKRHSKAGRKKSGEPERK